MGMFDSIVDFFSGASKPPLKNQKTKKDESIGDDILQELKQLESTISDNEIPTALTDDFKYTENFGAFDVYTNRLRAHQIGALESIHGHDIGQITIPTGTGKTYIQVHIHIADMIAKTKMNQSGVYVISAHRLALCSQLLDDMLEVAVECGIKFDIMYIGSERYNDDKVHHKFKDKGLNKSLTDAKSTTSKYEVAEMAKRAKARGRHLITVSTYHSFHKLELIDGIDICTYDEAHISLQDRFIENITLIKPKIKREYFFTATRKVSGENFGMNNTEFFGDILYSESPKKMIENGEIVPPRIHVIKVDRDEGTYDKTEFENNTMLTKTIIDGFKEHKSNVKRVSNNPDAIGAKLLVTFKGSKDMFSIHEDPIFERWCKDNNVNICAVSSTRGDYYNFESMRRAEVIDKMGELKDNDDAILLHIDILAEGIDLPSITGVMPFRDLAKSKLLQTIGRGARLLLDDRMALYNGYIQPQEYDKMIKPYCWVILSNDIFSDYEQMDKIRETITIISETYSIPIEELPYGGVFKGDAEDPIERITDKDSSNTNDSECELVHIIENMMCTSFSDKTRILDNNINFITNELQKIK